MEKEKSKYSDYKQKYSKENYHRIPLDIKKSDFQRWKSAAENASEPLNTYIRESVENRIASENTNHSAD